MKTLTLEEYIRNDPRLRVNSDVPRFLADQSAPPWLFTQWHCEELRAEQVTRYGPALEYH